MVVSPTPSQRRRTGWTGWCCQVAAWGLIAVIGSGWLSAEEPTHEIPADHPAIRFSDFVEKETLADGTIRFHRILDVPGRGYRWDNPGARVRFRTDARSVTVHLRYSEKHVSPSARAPVGLFVIDGQSDRHGTFTSQTAETLRPVEMLNLRLPVPPETGFHDYSVVMPYGDSVDFCGLTVSGGAAFEPPTARPTTRYVAYGDSVTQGFNASQVGFTYPYRVADARGWELVNLGLGGRTARAAEGDVVGRLGGDIVTVMIGVNDWQGGVEPASYLTAMRGLIAGIRHHQPDVPLYVITPLWVSPNWHPPKARFDLALYRQTLADLVAELKDPAVHLIDGPALIDADERFFDRVLVHPNDAGFAQLSERLARQIEPVR